MAKHRMRDDEERERVLALTHDFVAKQIEDGTLDPSDDAALRKAVEEAVDLAVATYRAACDYVFGK